SQCDQSHCGKPNESANSCCHVLCFLSVSSQPFANAIASRRSGNERRRVASLAARSMRLIPCVIVNYPTRARLLRRRKERERAAQRHVVAVDIIPREDRLVGDEIK